MGAAAFRCAVPSACPADLRGHAMNRLSPVRGEPDQVPRLKAFRARYPQVVIGTLGYGGAWQARIPEEHGETVITRYLLEDLLDRLAELLGEPEAGQ